MKRAKDGVVIIFTHFMSIDIATFFCPECVGDKGDTVRIVFTRIASSSVCQDFRYICIS